MPTNKKRAPSREIKIRIPEGIHEMLEELAEDEQRPVASIASEAVCVFARNITIQMSNLHARRTIDSLSELFHHNVELLQQEEERHQRAKRASGS